MPSDLIGPALIMLWVLFVVVVVFRRAFRGGGKLLADDVKNARSEFRSTRSDFGRMWALFRRGRASGLGVSDALSQATDQFSKGDDYIPPARPAPPPPARRDWFGTFRTMLVNAVTVIGVFGLQWPVGTGLALYWSENLLTGVAITCVFALWRAKHAADIEKPNTSTGDVATITLVFNAGHFVFLFAFLGWILPRVSPTDRFDRGSFTRGVVVIAALVLLDFAITVWRIRDVSARQLQDSAMWYLQRVTVLHLAIIFGMFALALFGQARVFFAVFAALKTIADVSRRLQT